MPKRKDKEIEVEEANKKEKSTPFTLEKEERKETPVPIKAYVPPIYFFQRLQKKAGQAICQFHRSFQEVTYKHPFCRYISTTAQLCQISKENSF